MSHGRSEACRSVMRIAFVGLVAVSMVSCTGALCPGVEAGGFEPPKFVCSEKYSGTSVCRSGQAFTCTSDACFSSVVDGPCLPAAGSPPAPPEGVKICTAWQDVMPDVPCDASREGAVWCKGGLRWQCIPSPESCWGANTGSQPCTINAD